ncbi:MAG: MG2 domain-containing protein [Deltaproteobacteria bacterium]|nr:MG2 domain-containing protein [Deltaproteobacteria bacterium]
MRRVLLFFSLCFIFLYNCSNNTDASTDLRIEDNKKDIDYSPSRGDGEAQKSEEYIPEKLFKKEKWENISEPNVAEWSKIKKLINEQKYEAAYSELEKLLKKFRDANEFEKITHVIMKMTQLRIALHGYETAVKFLKSESWPEGLYSQMVLNLYYAYSLVSYYNNYSWEINQREKVDHGGEIDIKKFTKEDIYYEAQRAYLRVFANREALSDIKVKSFSNYIQPNSYPERIRGTLRDAITYLYVELLNNTNLWEPDELNMVYTLPINNMVPSKKIVVNLSDKDTHPLLKIVYILDDLYEWHSFRKEDEAAFEALLTKLEILYSRFTYPKDREVIKEFLENVLKRMEHLEWWTVGMATLVDFYMKEDKPDSLIKAHRIAAECQKRFLSSIGSKMCYTKQKIIESPSYEVAGMSVDKVNQRSVLVSYKNLRRIYLRAYKLDFFSLLNKSYDYYLLPQSRQLDNIVFGSKPDFEWSEELEETKDFQVHKKYIIPPFKEKGLYLIALSARKNFPKNDNVIKGIYMIISDMVIELRNDYDSSLKVRVIDGNNGAPIQDVEVCLYRYDWKAGHKKDQCDKSNTFGNVKFSSSYDSSTYFLVARKGKDFTTDMQYVYFYNRLHTHAYDRTIIFTDRSIYRPLQKIKWKIVHFYGDGMKGKYEVVPNRKLEVFLYDYNRQVVDKKEVITNEFGTASGEFTIPLGRLLGNWTIGTVWGTQNIRVEEYKRPTFEVTLKRPEIPLRLNKEAEVIGEAKYYFGLPVSSGKVRYVVFRQPRLPYWWEHYSHYFRFYGFNQQPDVVDTGNVFLDKDGKFKVRFVPNADERLSDISKEIYYWYKVEVDVTDEGGETRSASQLYMIGFSSVEAKIVSDLKFFIAKDKNNKIRIIRTGLNGEPRAGNGSYKIVQLKEPEKTLMPSEIPSRLPNFFKIERFEEYKHKDDYLTPRWDSNYSVERMLFELKDDLVVTRGNAIHHKEDGEYTIDISQLGAGLYKIYYETIDEFGNKYETSKPFIVVDSVKKFNLPLVFYSQKEVYKVGEKARFFINSGLSGQNIFLYLYQSGKTEKEEVIIPSGGSIIYEFDVQEELRGGFIMHASMVNDYQIIKMSENIMVPWDNKELKIEFVTFRDTMRPGSKEVFKIKVSGPDNVKSLNKITELISYMYDKSLDYFVPHRYIQIQSLYPRKTNMGSIRSNIYPTYPYWVDSNGFNPIPYGPQLLPDSLKYISGYGIGGLGYRRKGRVSLQGDLYKDYDTRTLHVVRKAAAPPMKGVEKSSSKDYASLESEHNGVREKISTEHRSEDLSKEKEKMNTLSMVETDKSTEIRSEFSETAFFLPHLILEPDNTVSIEFSVPDSLTTYNLFVHAITKDLMGGSIKKEIKTIKNLMVRPYLPRFLREGDEANIKVVVNNASDKDVSGELILEIIEPISEKDLRLEFGLKDKDSVKKFSIRAKGSTNLLFTVRVPKKISLINFKVIAKTGEFSDGELRTVPLLPGRMHLAQSKFVVLRDRVSKTLQFNDLVKKDDPTLVNDQLTITLDAQLFLTVLQSLPYLVNYPYECTEQILNKFVSTGIISSVYNSHPAIAEMARIFSKERDTRLEKWDKPDPNRKMLLEETPWFNMAKGGYDAKEDLVNILNPEIAKSVRDISLNRLRNAQTYTGGFPWFPGGPPSPYITLYILYGLSKAIEYKVDVPKDMILKGWQYLHNHFINKALQYAKDNNCCWEMITFLNYTLSNYPDSSYYGNIFTQEKREEMLEFSFKHWKRHSPYLKGYLALTLSRMNRHKDAILVFESVMDSAKYSDEEGTHWVPEDRGWLWYNDSIETHAFAIRTLLEIMPQEKKLDGLVQWILMNKKLNHWKSTRATAEVIYSLIKYMEMNKTLGIKEEARILVGKDEYKFVFEPNKYVGRKNQIVIPGEKIDPDIMSKITFEKTTKGIMFGSVTWHFSTEQTPLEGHGDLFAVSRMYFKREPTVKGYVLKPIDDNTRIYVGDQIEVQISIKSKHPSEYVHLRDPRPAGCEPESSISKHKWDSGIYWYEEVRDSAQNFFFEYLPQGEYTFKYRIRANMAGKFRVAPATIQSMYAPEFNAYSKGDVITIF